MAAPVSQGQVADVDQPLDVLEPKAGVAAYLTYTSSG